MQTELTFFSSFSSMTISKPLTGYRIMGIKMNSVDRIRTLMALDGMNQRELALRLGYKHESSISKNFSIDGPSPKFIHRLETTLRWSGEWIRNGLGSQRLPTVINDESVNVSQPGKRNQSNVNYKGHQDNTPTNQDEIARLRLQLQEEKIRSLEREKELLEEMNRLLKERQK